MNYWQDMANMEPANAAVSGAEVTLDEDVRRLVS